MTKKSLVTVILIGFVVLSASIMIVKAFSRDSEIAGIDKIEGTKIVAYYLHGTQRCPTCLKIEKYASAVVDSFFDEPIAKQALEFKSLNYDEPQYAHFNKDFELVSQSLVLVRYKDGVQQEWLNLDKIWEYVDDQDHFYAYVKGGIEDYLGKLE